MRVAIVHYWLTLMRGGEKVLEEICQLYPEADIFTHVVDPSRISPIIASHRIMTTFIAKLPGAKRHYQLYLPLMPLALEQLDLRGYDLVISSESGPAKGVITDPDALHVCYCHTPMRYLWNMYHEYRSTAGVLTRLMMAPIFHCLRQWDYVSAARVDYFIANSSAVAARIQKTYRRDAIVIHPPVDTQKFSLAAERGDYFLHCGQLVSYKRADIAVEAFNRLGLPLVVVGDGEQLARLRKIAAPNITFLGWQSDIKLKELYARCRALIFPGEEDFGIVPVEAMASGSPVVAFDRGGVRDSVIDGVTGVLFRHQTVDGLVDAVKRFIAIEKSFDRQVLVDHAAHFDRASFRKKFAAFIEEKLSVSDHAAHLSGS